MIVSELNNFYDKIYVISLRSNVERKEYISAQFEKLGVEFEFFDAICGNELTEDYINEVYDEEGALNDRTGSRTLSKSEIGCALSHISIYKMMLTDNLETVLIFEDDIKVNIECYANLEQIHGELPENWDILYYGIIHNFKAPVSYRLKLYFYYPLILLLRPGKLKYTYKQLKKIYPRKYSPNLLSAGYHHGAHAYGLTKNAAERILNRNTKITAPIDCAIAGTVVDQEISGYLVKDLVFVQNRRFASQVEHSGF